MTQKLASANADGRPLDFGLAITFDAQGMHVSGRADSAGYRAVWPDFTAASVTLTDVAYDYALPVPARVEPPSDHQEDALTFKRRFTSAERQAIRAAIAAGDHIAGDFLDLLDTGAMVNAPVRFNDPDVIAGLNYLEQVAHVIAAGRAAQILTP